MYSTCVSSCRVPLMNVTAEMIGQSPWPRTISSAPSPFSVVIIVASGKWPSSVAAAASSPGALVARMPRSNGGISAGSFDAVIDAVQLAPPAHPQAPRVQRVRVLPPPREDADVGHLRQMPGEEAADHATADDAHPLDHPSSFL